MTRIIALLFLLVPILVKAQWTTSGSNIYNTNTGNVGIGFTSPDRKLYVRGIYSTTNAVSAFELQNSSATESVAASFYAYPASTTGNLYLKSTFMMYLGGTTGVHMNFANPKSNGTIRFHTAGFDSEATQRMIINYDGNIGIGNVNPQAKLHISGGDLLLQNPTSGYPLLWLKDVSGSNSLRLDYNSLIGAGGNLVIRSPSANAIVLNDVGGNVGIGTTTPAYKLHVNGAINATALYVNGAPFTGGGGVQSYFDITPGSGNGLRFWNDNAYKIHMGNSAEYLYGPVTDYSIKMNMSSDVGRGWTWGGSGATPVAALSNTGKMKIAGGFEAVGPGTGTGPTILANGGGDVVLNSGGSVFFDGNYNYAAGNYIRPVAANTQAFFTSGAERLRIASNGNVGIGTTLAANPNNYKLAVNGLIGAKEVKVENTSTTWPDYVFSSDYKLKPLLELEQYINENKHLPEVPSASDIAVNGHALGEMNALLLKKVEELTLYIIELKKEVDSLKTEKK